MGSNINVADRQTLAAMGSLLVHAEQNASAKRVLTAYTPTASRTANLKALSQFKVDMLESCASLINIDLANGDGHKIYTKDPLILRIHFGIRSFLPGHCQDCQTTYMGDIDANGNTLFSCHMCYRSSHDCDGIKKLHTALNEAGLALVDGHVWLCHDCKASSVPMKPRKSKVAHSGANVSSSSKAPGSELVSHEQSGIMTPTLAVDEKQDPSKVAQFRSDLEQGLKELAQSNICKEYRAGKCPHGFNGMKEVSGEICQFGHPKKCIKFSRFGKDTDKGCTKGKECEYFHPTLCRSTFRKKQCADKDCTYVHPKQAHKKESEKKEAEKKLTKEVSKKKAKSKEDSSTKSKKGKQDPFLELKELVMSMRTSFDLQIKSIKACLPAQDPDQCRQSSRRSRAPSSAWDQPRGMTHTRQCCC